MAGRLGGHWEGESLVVETTNFTDRTAFQSSGPNRGLPDRRARISRPSCRSIGRICVAHGLDLSDIRGTVPISPFLYVEEVAPDRPKTVWGTDEAVWREASVKPYIDSGRPPMLLIYADGDDDWRREQNERLKMELKGAGNSDVDAVEIADRTHGSILSKMAEAGDPGMSRIAAFIKSH